MTDYFFVSSPLHFLIAANLSIHNPDNRAVLIVMARTPATARRFADIAGQHPDIFAQTLTLPYGPRPRRHIRSPHFQALKPLFTGCRDARLFTGNDRRIEFQYAMHIASQTGERPQGIYMDEGVVTYLGHKSMHRMAHRYLDPCLKKLLLGRWYAPAPTTGASAWINSIYAAFPDHIHPLLKGKPCNAIPPEPFASPAFESLIRTMLEADGTSSDLLASLKLVITLPHEAGFRANPQIYDTISRHFRAHFSPRQIAVKPHPRMTDQQSIERIFPGTTILEPTTGMEVLSTVLDKNCLVAGDISSTLLTTKWLRPALPVVALMVNTAPPPRLTELYAALGIPMVQPDALPAWLRRQ